MYKISNSQHGAQEYNLIRLYKIVIRPILDYGCAIYGDASKTTLGKLDSIQHKILCKALGVIRLSSKTFVNVETNTMPLQIRRTAFTLKLSQSNLDRQIPILDNKRRSTLNIRRFKTLNFLNMNNLYYNLLTTKDINKILKHT